MLEKSKAKIQYRVDAGRLRSETITVGGNTESIIIEELREKHDTNDIVLAYLEWNPS